MANFSDVLNMAMNLGFVPKNVSNEDQLFYVSDPSEGIVDLLIDCEGELVALEQPVMQITEKTDYAKLMELNRNLVHGAFCVDNESKKILWRDTLRLETLDQEELAGSINALSLSMVQDRSVLLPMMR